MSGGIKYGMDIFRKAFAITRKNKKFILYNSLIMPLAYIEGILIFIKKPVAGTIFYTHKSWPYVTLPIIEFLSVIIIPLAFMVITHQANLILKEKRPKIIETIKSLARNIKSITIYIAASLSMHYISASVKQLSDPDLIARITIIIAIIYFAIGYISFFVIPAIMIDDLGLYDSIKRSIHIIPIMLGEILGTIFWAIIYYVIYFLIATIFEVTYDEFTSGLLGKNIYAIIFGSLVYLAASAILISLLVTAIQISITLLYNEFKQKNM